MEIIEVKNIEYYTVSQFANLTNKSQQTIRRLIIKGNKVRKLEALKVNQTVLIPISELTAYPFTICGRSYQIYYYDKEGKILEGVGA